MSNLEQTPDFQTASFESKESSPEELYSQVAFKEHHYLSFIHGIGRTLTFI